MNSDVDWKGKFQEIVQLCQKEIKRTTIIGKKMITASKSNTELHRAYEDLGRIIAREIKEQRLECNHPQVKELLDSINKCESALEKIEKEVKKIKKLNSNSASGTDSQKR